MSLYSYGRSEPTDNEFRDIENAFLKLDRRERPFRINLIPTAGSGDTVAIQSQVSTVAGLPVASVSFGPVAPNRQSASGATECPRIGRILGAFFEVGWINQVAGAGQFAVMRYRFVFLPEGSASIIQEEVTRTYPIPATDLFYNRDRITLRAENVVEKRLMAVYITRMNTDAADTYKAGASVTRAVHIVDTRFMLRGQDGEDV